MKVADMLNLYTAYNEAADYRILVLAADVADAQHVVQGYATESEIKGTFLVTETVDTCVNYDCDRVISALDFA